MLEWNRSRPSRETLRDRFPLYTPGDRVSLRTKPLAFELFYETHSPSCDARSRSQLQLFLYPNDGIVWIANLLVNPQHRHKGMGRHLVSAAEQIALHVHCRVIRVHPRYEAIEFWT